MRLESERQFTPHAANRYALGSRGATKRKLAAAAGCIVEFIGMTAYFCGYPVDRERGMSYTKWLLTQRGSKQGKVLSPEVEEMMIGLDRRDDVVVVEIPKSYIGWIRGKQGKALREIETTTNTFCFSDSDREQTNHRVLIFAFDAPSRLRAESLIRDRVKIKDRMDANSGGPPRGPPPAPYGASPYTNRDARDGMRRRDAPPPDDRDAYRRDSRGADDFRRDSRGADDFRRDSRGAGRGDDFRRAEDARGREPRDDSRRDSRGDFRPEPVRRDDYRSEQGGYGGQPESVSAPSHPAHCTALAHPPPPCHPLTSRTENVPTQVPRQSPARYRAAATATACRSPRPIATTSRPRARRPPARQLRPPARRWPPP
jgi:hypothetical protein